MRALQRANLQLLFLIDFKRDSKQAYVKRSQASPGISLEVSQREHIQGQRKPFASYLLHSLET